MSKFFTLSLALVNLAFLAGCATKPEPASFPYVSVSDGLPTGQQWKCNPAFGDVNGDGLLDLAAIPRKGKGAQVWLNVDGRKWVESSDGLGRGFSCGGGVDFGDVNNDGFLDLAVGDHCRGVQVYAGDGAGEWTLSAQGLAPMAADDVALGDLNRDGNLDLAACSVGNEGIRLFLGNGDGTWQGAAHTGLPVSGGCRELALADFNHDGVPDIAATMMEKARVWLSTEAGVWVDSSNGLPDLSFGGQYRGVAVGDVNEDGHPDLALGRINKGPEVYLGDGGGGWRPAVNGLANVRSARGVALGDMDGDGRVDLLVSGMQVIRDGNAHGVFYFRGDGTGNWKLLSDTGLPAEGLHKSWGLALGDIDSDGTLDVAGCFGSSYQMSPSLFAKMMGRATQADASPQGDSGHGGGVMVWKRH